MSLVVAKAKRAERKKIIDQMNNLVPADGNITAENLAQHAKLDAAQDLLRKEIEAIEHQDDLNKEIKARLERTAIATGKSPDEISDEERERSAAHMAWMRNGMAGIPEEQRALLNGHRGNFTGTEETAFHNVLSSSDMSGGAVLVPTLLQNKIISAELAFGGMIDPNVCSEIRTDTGAEMPFPTDDDTSSEGEFLADSQESDEENPKFGLVRMQAYMASSKIVRVPYALLQDSVIDLDTFIANKFGIRLARAENRKFTVGTGASQPLGAFTIAPVGVIGAAGQTTSITYSDIISLKHSVDPNYRNGARFMMHDTTLRAIKLLVDGVGRPIWQSGLATKEPDTIDGDPYTINQHSPIMASNAKSMAYGQFKLYTIRRAGGVMMLRLTERYAEKGQVGFLAFERVDGNLMDAGTHPIKCYQNAA